MGSKRVQENRFSPDHRNNCSPKTAPYDPKYSGVIKEKIKYTI
jgi:hypothetical protein